MRYSDTHKDETHIKILKIAGRMLREKGPNGLAVAEVMQKAGLTHGGFYAHFRSKESLMVEALKGVFADSKNKFQDALRDMPPAHALATYIDLYVSPTHRDNLSSGCPVTALNSDMPRQPKKVRDVFNAGLQFMIDGMERRINAIGLDSDGDEHSLAASIISAMAGAVSIARTISDKRLSDEMLESARASIKQRLGLTDAALSKGTVQ